MCRGNTRHIKNLSTERKFLIRSEGRKSYGWTGYKS
nr:MAG TPA: hypothetical protein [Caudoviricetes sp.]